MSYDPDDAVEDDDMVEDDEFDEYDDPRFDEDWVPGEED